MTTFNFTTGDPNNLVAGGAASMGDIQGPFVDLRTFLNGRSLNEDNLPVSMLQKLGLNDTSGQKGRGKSIIATTGTRTNVAYGALSDAADQVSGIVLPTDGLIAVAYQAVWQSSVSNAASAGLFLGATQVKVNNGTASPVNSEVPIINGAGVNQDLGLTTMAGGLNSPAGTAYTGDVTTGQIVGNLQASAQAGGPCYIFAAAGTYTVSIQFKASSGSVTAKNRKLWVWALGF